MFKKKDKPPLKLADVMASFTSVLTDLDTFIKTQADNQGKIDQQVNDLMNESFDIGIDITKASKVRENISKLIEE
jgi:hypothetical protein